MTLSSRPALVIMLLMLFAGLFSVFFMLPQSLGLDEAQSIWQSAHSVGGILYVVGQDVHVPLYHLILHFWQMQFGNGVAAARILSLLFYLPAIPLVYLLGRIAFKSSVGLFAAVIFALSPFTNWYGSVIRMYSLLALLTILNQIFFLLLYKGTGRRPAYWAGYFVTALLGIYTHYFFGFILIVQAIFVLAYLKQFPKRTFLKFTLVALVLIACLAPWLWYVHSLGGLGANTSPQLLPPSTVDIFNTFSNFFFGFQSDVVNTIILSSWPIIMLLLFLAIQKNRNVPPEMIYLTATVLIPIALAAALSHILEPFYLSRYFIGVFPALCIAASWFFSLYPRSASVMARTVLVGAMVVMLRTQTTSASTPIKEDYQQVAAYVSSHATARDIVAVSTPFTIYPLEYYYNGQAALTTLPLWNRLQSGAIPEFTSSTLVANLDTLKNYEKIYLVLSYDQGYQEPLRLYLDTHYERLSVEHFSQGLDLYTYRIRYDNATLSDALAIARSAGAAGIGGPAVMPSFAPTTNTAITNPKPTSTTSATTTTIKKRVPTKNVAAVPPPTPAPAPTSTPGDNATTTPATSTEPATPVSTSTASSSPTTSTGTTISVAAGGE